MKSDLIARAMHFAMDHHQGVLRDDGKDYFDDHIEQVAKIVKLITDDEQIIAAAYLHDIIEDTHVTYEDLIELFGQRVADLVNEVTHDGKPDSKGYYFPRLHTKEAIIIKFADRLSNLGAMSVWDKERQKQYLKKSKFWRSE